MNRVPAAEQSDPAELLRRHDIQVTTQRVAVMAAVPANAHGTADDIAESVRSEIGAISRQAVYDAPTTILRTKLHRIPRTPAPKEDP